MSELYGQGGFLGGRRVGECVYEAGVQKRLHSVLAVESGRLSYGEIWACRQELGEFVCCACPCPCPLPVLYCIVLLVVHCRLWVGLCVEGCRPYLV